MQGRYTGILIILMTFALSGCASMSGDECALNDWYTIGFEDGSNGYAANRLGQHRKACAKHGVAPDFQAYQSGRDDGLRDFCQPSRGYNLGASGGRYSGVCPASLEVDFIDGYNSGHQLYSLRSRVSTASRQINSKESELERTHKRIREVEADLISSDTTVEDRILLLADLKDLSEKTGELEAEILDLREDRVIYERELENYQAMIAGAGY